MVDVGWISPDFAGQPVQISLKDGTWLGDGIGTCDGDGTCPDAQGICHLSLQLPLLAPGLYGVCVAIPAANASSCSPNALAIVTSYADPATIVHVSDAHVGYNDAVGTFGNVVASINNLVPPPDFVIFTGDAADEGLSYERAMFLAEIEALNFPTFVVTGNHDYDHGPLPQNTTPSPNTDSTYCTAPGEGGGIVGHLLDVGPELDYQGMYGGLQLVGMSSGQDLDDGQNQSTISESYGPDASQIQWASTWLTKDAPPTIVFFHHPIYNAIFATIGPSARPKLISAIRGGNVRAVLSGHTHISAVFDADGNSRGLSLDADSVPSARWPLHYIASRASRAPGGYAILHVGTSRVDYRWVELP